MLYKEYNHIEISKIIKFVDKKPVWKRGNIITGDKVPEYYGKTDHFVSVARFKPSVVDYINDNDGKIRGYDGAIWMDWIVVDVDEKSPDKVSLFLNHLSVNYEIPIDYNRLYFSGNKGFHVLIPSPLFGLRPSRLLHRVIEKIVERIAFKVIPYDKSLYDKNQVYRLQFTKHSSTGLYKTPIDYNELQYNITKIKNLSREIRSDFPFPVYPVDPVDYLVQMARECSDEVANMNGLKTNGDLNGYIYSNGEDDSYAHIPIMRKLCIYSMLKGVTESTSDGSPGRNETCYRLAKHFKKEGYDVDFIIGALSGWNYKNKPPLSESEIVSIVSSAFKDDSEFGCRDSVLRHYCDINCHLFRG